MEKPSEPCVPVPLDLKLVNFNNLDFILVFEEGKCIYKYIYIFLSKSNIQKRKKKTDIHKQFFKMNFIYFLS